MARIISGVIIKFCIWLERSNRLGKSMLWDTLMNFPYSVSCCFFTPSQICKLMRCNIEFALSTYPFYFPLTQSQKPVLKTQNAVNSPFRSSEETSLCPSFDISWSELLAPCLSAILGSSHGAFYSYDCGRTLWSKAQQLYQAIHLLTPEASFPSTIRAHLPTQSLSYQRPLFRATSPWLVAVVA